LATTIRWQAHTDIFPLAAPLPIDLRRFAAKHADVALSANLASKNFVQIAVATMRIGMPQAK
jgi:hypothetical protein